jgi:glycyl-tRNA synthetase beta chain
MKEFLLELYSEEIPARMQKNAESGFLKIFENFFKENKIEYQDLEVHVSPCRIVIFSQIKEELASSDSEIKGPRVGANSQAIDGFARKNNIKFDDLYIKKIGDDEFYFANLKIEERYAADIISENLEPLISSYVWPKSMLWGNNNFSWVRPLKNILCILGGKIVTAKVSHLSTNNISFGHKFMSPTPFEVKDSASYKHKLKENLVIIESQEREKILQDSFSDFESSSGYKIIWDKKLFEEVAGLCEYPVLLQGSIDEKFMQLPEEVLITAVKVHQKFFTVRDKEGNLAPIFLFATNLKMDDYSEIIRGNERVLSARLSDALYFYEEDKKNLLENNISKLEYIIFHKEIGNMKEKIERVQKLASTFSPLSAKAAGICKSDLVSEVVLEFPELQGIMGSYYASYQGFSNEICIAVKDHYKPLGADDEIPENDAAFLAISDKIDSLVTLMIAGERATGSKDPYALRRLALGIIRIILKNRIELDLLKFVKLTYTNFRSEIDSKIYNDIKEFLEERLKSHFKTNYSTPVVNACVNLQANTDILSTEAIIMYLDNFILKEEGQNLLQLYRRAKNISLELNKNTINIDINIFQTKSEENLYFAISEVNTQMDKNLSSKNIQNCMKILANLETPLSDFFENNLVNTEDIRVSNNRKAILLLCAELFEKIANFQEL